MQNVLQSRLHELLQLLPQSASLVSRQLHFLLTSHPALVVLTG